MTLNERSGEVAALPRLGCHVPELIDVWVVRSSGLVGMSFRLGNSDMANKPRLTTG